MNLLLAEDDLHMAARIKEELERFDGATTSCQKYSVVFSLDTILAKLS